MRVQQVPNSPYFIHYADNSYCSVSRDKDDKEPIPESEMQAFLDAVANGTVISYQCRSMDEAVDMVAALYNGKKAEATQA